MVILNVLTANYENDTNPFLHRTWNPWTYGGITWNGFVAIACRRFPGTHIAKRIADILTDINASFGLDVEKIKATSRIMSQMWKFSANLVQIWQTVFCMVNNHIYYK